MPESRKYIQVAVPVPVDKLFTYEVPEELQSSADIGKRVVVPFGNRQKTGFIVEFTELKKYIGKTAWKYDGKPPQIRKITKIIDDVPLVDDSMLKLTRWIADYYLCSWGTVLQSAVPLKTTLKDLPDKQEETETCRHEPGVQYREQTPENFNLTDEQKNALDLIKTEIESKERKIILLKGVTGSGKTEVYLRTIEEVIKKGQQAIVLVPEISLTPQTLQRFCGRFPGRVAVWHSRLTQKERSREWRKMFLGEADIVVGARSAVFAPFKNPGLIILDEEHEATYKQEEEPRYHARSVAIKRAYLTGCIVVLGSATPAIESFYQTTQGNYWLSVLSHRIDHRPMPDVEIVDMKLEPPEMKNRVFSDRLVSEIKNRLDRREKIILFLNRRGFATFVLCRDCGFRLSCPQCSVSLIYHAEDRTVRCHYCNYRKHAPDMCPSCHGHRIRYFGTGTERIEQEILELFKGAKVLRMDADTTRKRKSHGEILGAFQDGKAEILVGTQMIAKGLDFPEVTLVGIVSADTMLNLPDFREAERTFQLITQVSGRCGRGNIPGQVIVQTYNPDHYSLMCAKNHDDIGFFNQEIVRRKLLGYPPFVHMANLMFRGMAEKKTEEAAEKTFRALESEARNLRDVSVFEPGSAPIARIKGQFRYQVIVKGKKTEDLLRLLRKCLAESTRLAGSAGVMTSIDIDPQSIL